MDDEAPAGGTHHRRWDGKGELETTKKNALANRWEVLKGGKTDCWIGRGGGGERAEWDAGNRAAGGRANPLSCAIASDHNGRGSPSSSRSLTIAGGFRVRIESYEREE